jgi:hypothetical protein
MDTTEQELLDAAGMLYTQDSSDRAIIDAVARIAKARDVGRAQIALAWLRHNPVVVAPLVGASKPSHVENAGRPGLPRPKSQPVLPGFRHHREVIGISSVLVNAKTGTRCLTQILAWSRMAGRGGKAGVGSTADGLNNETYYRVWHSRSVPVIVPCQKAGG